MLLYYFTQKKYGLENLQKQRLKISDFSNVNDPFELLGVELSDRDTRKVVTYEKSKVSSEIGLLCFSSNKYSPVQWAHYADDHKGICLGFEVSDEKVKEIKYVSERLSKSILEDKDKNEKLLTTKFKHWSYEKEFRMLTKLTDYKPDDKKLRFKSFDSDMKLKEIYLGHRSNISFSQVEESFNSSDKSVTVKHTRPAFRDFRIVWDRSKKSIKV